MKKLLVTYFMVASVFVAGFLATPAFAEVCPNEGGALGFPAWFKGLSCTHDTTNGNDSWTVNIGTKVENTWIIVMNILQWLIIAGGYVALYFVIWGGFKFITAQGEPDRIKSARETILNAVIGLIIVLAAVAIVQTIQNGIKGTIT